MKTQTYTYSNVNTPDGENDSIIMAGVLAAYGFIEVKQVYAVADYIKETIDDVVSGARPTWQRFFFAHPTHAEELATFSFRIDHNGYLTVTIALDLEAVR